MLVIVGIIQIGLWSSYCILMLESRFSQSVGAPTHSASLRSVYVIFSTDSIGVYDLVSSSVAEVEVVEVGVCVACFGFEVPVKPGRHVCV